MSGKEALLISACLTGTCCKYNCGHNALPPETLAALRERYSLVLVCPERDGGLPTPRESSERRDGGVFTRSGRDVTASFERGARLALTAARENGCAVALLKERSPSCGSGRIYDGTFTGTLIPGDGVTAALLKENGLAVYSETEVDRILT